eukprot:CAMPEP_0198284942 /NCGR_PEP_ID=MMETSP1449-20131203/4299_1 /TAXON_ID=420275 /ORGANISM="Attheya septentrionalis, Strain CCMP2084" /LENGTH=1003 /DNA_ID=CAMNT_0043982167 /DNA_START=46 /DNA_END=3057 /DNA_ORIENTATION=-
MSYPENDTTDFVATLDTNRVQQEMLQTHLSKAVSSSSHGAHPFTTTLKDELHRVTKFVIDQQESLERSAKALFLRADALTTATGTMQQMSVQESYAIVHDHKRSTRKTVDDCLALQVFFTKSRAMLLENASMADEKLGKVRNSFGQAVSCSSLVHEIMPKAHLNSSLVCIMSDIYHALRHAEEQIENNANANAGDDGDAPLWQSPSSFQRATTKYWVKDQNLTKLMMTCAIEAPLLVYGKKGPLTSTDPRDAKVSDGDKLWDSLATRITSIYFDSHDMSLYKERLKRAEGAQLLRARWYGPTIPTGDKIIFVELKTHHEKWVGNKSVKERALIQERDMLTFLLPVPWKREDAEQMIIRAKPKMKAEELAKATGLLLRMHNLVVNHKLTACIRSVYDRAAFQSSKSNDLRLTLDRNVTVVNERVPRASSISEQQWCLTDSEAQTAPATVVPFNVFEVKLASDDPMPTGLAEAQNDSTIELATKFSKFLTGAAAFNAVPTLPYWAAHPAFYSFFELDKRGSQSPSSSESNDTHQGDYNLMGSRNEMGSGILRPKGVVIAPKNPARIEPKTYFANERTFVQWINTSILLLSISSFLLAAGHDYSTTAAVISLSALVLIMYSTRLYFRRLTLLTNREPYGYFNKVNPIFLTSVVGLAIFLIWADSVNGNDFLDFLSPWRGEANGRRLLRPLLSGRILSGEYEKCPREVIGTKLSTKDKPSSIVVDFKRHSFIMTSGDSVYIQPMNDDGSVPSKADLLIRINQSHLEGLAIVGNQLFAVSGGPERTELIEMAWWGTRDGNKRLRVVGRWTLEDSSSQVDGFSFVPSTDPTPMGSFYINMNSSIRTYSLPARSKTEEPHQPAHPMRLKSLNMKVFTQAMAVGDKESHDSLSTMITFEGITYILRPKRNVLEAWNLADGTNLSEIELPVTDEDDAMMKWTGFALERRIATSTETPNVRGGDMLGMLSSNALHLHLMADEQIWSFPVLENIETPGGLFSVPHCQIATTSMN